ncbi:MAG: PD-(D/E)XK nuclease family protein [Planctomycetota bacterium]|nr:PD-(D/E)XK nuclease family protein [Planctomycetota bacterium]
MPDPVGISPSQIKTYHEQCPRRWWYSRNRPRPPRRDDDPAVFGDRVHLVLEDWLQYGTVLDLGTREGKTAIAGLGFLPPPKAALVEGKFSFVYDRVKYNGRIDFTTDYEQGQHITIGDHKTIGQLHRHKTEDELVWDPQRIIYSMWGVLRYRVQRVTARWVYYQRVTKSRKHGKSTVVEFTEEADMIRERFEDLHKRRSLPILNARLDDRGPTALPRNMENCNLFPPHGCPYREECHGGLSSIDRLKAAFE